MSGKRVPLGRFSCVFFVCACLMLVLSMPASAEKTDWSDSDYRFSSVKKILLQDVVVGHSEELTSTVMKKTLQDDFVKNGKKTGCEIVTEEQARNILSVSLGEELGALAGQDPEKAKSLYQGNLASVANVRVEATIKDWSNDSYIVPARTVWEDREKKRTVWHNGEKHEETYRVTVPVTYPPRRVYISRIHVSFEVYDTTTGKMVFGREDKREREDENAQKSMYGRICNSFFEDFGKKIKGHS